MPTIGERLQNVLTGGKLAELDRAVENLAGINQRLVEAYQDGPYVLPPDQLLAQLREWYDPQLVDDLLDRMNWEVVGGYGGYNEDERNRAVLDSMRMFKYSPFARFMINLWTFYALGENVQIWAMDDTINEDVQEYLTARRNKSLWAKDRIDENSRWLLVTGERFYAHFGSTLDGLDTTRSVPPLQVVNIYTNPDDAEEIWFYKRQWQDSQGSQQVLFYPDWELYFSSDLENAWQEAAKVHNLGADVRRSDQMREQTQVVMQFMPYIRLDEDSPRGWPLLAPHGTPWVRAQRDFMQNRLAVSRAVASYVRRYKTQGGSRAVSAVRSALASSYQFGGTTESNTAPVPASSEIINQAVDVEDLPMTTGAQDARTDSDEFAWNMGVTAGLYPHMLGRGEYHRMATAEYMNKPMILQFSLYRKQLSTLFRQAVEISLRFREKYGGKQYESYDVEVSTDEMVEDDLTETTNAVVGLFRDVIWPSAELGQIPEDALQNVMVYSVQSVLQAMGASDVSEMINLDMYREPQPQEAALTESHTGELVDHTCPLCAFPQALSYPGHKGLLVCAECGRTFDPEVE